MPPKKSGKKEKKRDAPSGDVEGASVEELNQKIHTLEKEKNKEEEYRNYMQLERDKINAFWEITKKDLDDKKAELRNKDREMEEMEERHQVEIKVYKQKVKHLLYEHQNNITTLKADGELALKLQQDEFRKREAELARDKRDLKMKLKEQELSHQEMIRDQKLKSGILITKTREECLGTANETQHNYEKKMKMLRDDLELRRKQEIHEIEERKNSHINELMKKHERAFAEIKNYYNDITHNNLDLIKTLKEDVAEMKKREAQNEKLMYEIAQENKRLSEPLTKALKEVESLRHAVANYDKDKMSLAQTKARLVASEKQVKNLEWESEVLQQRFAKVQSERDELYDKFESSIYEVAQKTGLKGTLLERRLEAMSEALEMKEAQLAEVLTAANLDPSTLQVINTRLEEVLDNKNMMVKALQYDVAKVSKAHNDLINVYEAKLAEYGIPAEELGFRPLVTNTSAGPAGLVVGS
ncbi:growth-arrest-specific micro-tubule binding-domain-containing protein [Dunaliella salina]|uniref:Growth-arrest-specific micro-tubule binding-domain-containing protein n=1 Tax=Dunaliella salina TaxID=3046 RepID=A0ABQ7GGZ1_DUNSA|nr:growth-arrest-specific micro-tubule binding-domain-containing protein [Dunaliella salina]|eukprot:KAF5833874.1 growth-arrest-specific micro-tubule binding-domain-containing protein [Dunaliella salina]